MALPNSNSPKVPGLKALRTSTSAARLPFRLASRLASRSLRPIVLVLQSGSQQLPTSSTEYRPVSLPSGRTSRSSTRRTNSDLRELLRQVGIDPDKVRQPDRTGQRSSGRRRRMSSAADRWWMLVSWFETPRAAGARCPGCRLRGDAACRLICRFDPSARPAALVLLTSRMASGLMPAVEGVEERSTGGRQRDVRAPREDRPDRRIALAAAAVPRTVQAPSPVRACLALDATTICAGLLLEYATRGWDAQLATTIASLPLSTGGLLRKLADTGQAGSSSTATTIPSTKKSPLKSATAVDKEFNQMIDSCHLLIAAFLEELSPQFRQELKDCTNKLSQPDQNSGRSLSHCLSSERSRICAERLHQDTGIYVHRQWMANASAQTRGAASTLGRPADVPSRRRSSGPRRSRNSSILPSARPKRLAPTSSPMSRSPVTWRPPS